MSHKIKISEKVIVDNWHRKVISKDFDVWNWKVYNYLITWHCKTIYATMTFWLTKDKKVIYIKEYREWIENFIHSFSMWVYESDLSFEENARKELNEETWYVGEDIIYLWESIVANYDDTIMKYFFIDNCEFIWQSLEAWEDIKVFTCNIEEFEEKIKSWLISCPMTITCYTLAKMRWYV